MFSGFSATVWDSGVLEEMGGAEEWRRGWRLYGFRRDHRLVMEVPGAVDTMLGDHGVPIG